MKNQELIVYNTNKSLLNADIFSHFKTSGSIGDSDNAVPDFD